MQVEAKCEFCGTAAWYKVKQMIDGQSVSLLAPELGSCGSSGRARRLFAAGCSQSRVPATGQRRPRPQLLERAASKAAESTAFVHPGTVYRKTSEEVEAELEARKQAAEVQE